MMRFLLRRTASIQDVGYLLDCLEIEWRLPQELREFRRAAAATLTRLLPAAVQTDTLRLDEYQRSVLRRIVIGYADYIAQDKKGGMQAEDADFAGAALLAVKALGELRGDSKEHRAAHAAVQKLAEASPCPDEPLNHSYVREVARETLPLLHGAMEVKR